MLYVFNRVKLCQAKHMEILQRVIIDEVPHRWIPIATYLGFSFNKVDAIKSDHSIHGDGRCLYVVFGVWLRGEKGTGVRDRTLETMCGALEDCDCRDEAEMLLKEIETFIHKECPCDSHSDSDVCQ